MLTAEVVGLFGYFFDQCSQYLGSWLLVTRSSKCSKTEEYHHCCRNCPVCIECCWSLVPSSWPAELCRPAEHGVGEPLSAPYSTWMADFDCWTSCLESAGFAFFAGTFLSSPADACFWMSHLGRVQLPWDLVADPCCRELWSYSNKPDSAADYHWFWVYCSTAVLAVELPIAFADLVFSDKMCRNSGRFRPSSTNSYSSYSQQPTYRSKSVVFDIAWLIAHSNVLHLQTWLSSGLYRPPRFGWLSNFLIFGSLWPTLTHIGHCRTFRCYYFCMRPALSRNAMAWTCYCQRRRPLMDRRLSTESSWYRPQLSLLLFSVQTVALPYSLVPRTSSNSHHWPTSTPVGASHCFIQFLEAIFDGLRKHLWGLSFDICWCLCTCRLLGVSSYYSSYSSNSIILQSYWLQFRYFQKLPAHPEIVALQANTDFVSSWVAVLGKTGVCCSSL